MDEGGSFVFQDGRHGNGKLVIKSIDESLGIEISIEDFEENGNFYGSIFVPLADLGKLIRCVSSLKEELDDRFLQALVNAVFAVSSETLDTASIVSSMSTKS
jgi:hypothetical protein